VVAGGRGAGAKDQAQQGKEHGKAHEAGSVGINGPPPTPKLRHRLFRVL
jgi:hypothetical protein